MKIDRRELLATMASFVGGTASLPLVPLQPPLFRMRARHTRILPLQSQRVLKTCCRG